MKNEINYVFLTDGSSDQALKPIIDWTLRTHFPHHSINGEWFDFRTLPIVPKGIKNRIIKALQSTNTNLLIIHRDAERNPWQSRKEEIERVLNSLKKNGIKIPQNLAVIPIRMLEAWLLIDEKAIRKASDNPNGKVQLNMPPVKKLESLPDPKSLLYDLLTTASEKTPRRLKNFRVNHRVHLVAEYLENFEALRKLSAFEKFETEVQSLSF